MGEPRLREDKWLAQGFFSRTSPYDRYLHVTRPFGPGAKPPQEMIYELLQPKSVKLGNGDASSEHSGLAE